MCQVGEALFIMLEGRNTWVQIKRTAIMINTV
jgi:hypothetical protein